MGWKLDQLVAEHDRPLRAFVCRRGGARHVDDVVGEVWLAAVEAQRSGRELTPSWLYAVARNKLVDHWRRSERGDAMLAKLTVSACQAVLPEEPTTVGVALEGLPGRQRVLLERRYVDGYPTQTLADAEGRSYRAAESALARARVALRKQVVALESAA